MLIFVILSALATLFATLHFYGSNAGLCVGFALAFIGFIADRIVDRIARKIVAAVMDRNTEAVLRLEQTVAELEASLDRDAEPVGKYPIVAGVPTLESLGVRHADNFGTQCIIVTRYVNPESLMNVCRAHRAISGENYCVQFNETTGPEILSADELKTRLRNMGVPLSMLGKPGDPLYVSDAADDVLRRCGLARKWSDQYDMQCVVVHCGRAPVANKMLTPEDVINACHAIGAVRHGFINEAGDGFCVELRQENGAEILSPEALRSAVRKAVETV